MCSRPPCLTPAGLLHSLPQRATSFCAGAGPVPLPGTAGAVSPIAVATAAGTIELAAVQQGSLLPLHLSLSASLAAHTGPVQALRWLGPTPRLVSCSTEKVAAGYRNTLLITGEEAGGCCGQEGVLLATATAASVPSRCLPGCAS